MKKILLGLMMLTTAATMSAQLALRQEHYFDGRMSLCNKLYVVGLEDMYLIRGNDSLFHIYDSDYSLVHTFPQEPQIVAKNVFTEDGKICVVNVTNENDWWNTYRIEILKEESNLNIVDQEKQNIIRALHQCKNSKRMAAKMLGISERTLYRRIKDYDIE